ncbi:MAG: VTC domain-containing protein, partial [Bacteroidota bacterium]|nr:VTC domain-containing protein [Bacteroidota bacterium]
FLENLSPYSGSELQPKILSFFNRITLVDNEFTVRVTIDTLPGFKNEEKEIIINDLVIIEIKQNKNNKSALINQVLRSKKVRRQGFSKYCIGRSLLEENIKKNKFKPLLIRLKKEYFN